MTFIQQVVLWDMDGTLIDSEPLHYKKLAAVCERYGAEWDGDMKKVRNFRVPDGNGSMMDVAMPFAGAGEKNIYWYLIAQKPSLERTLTQEQWLNELLVYYIDHKQELKPRDNMVAMVNNLAANNAIQGIVTSGIPAQVEANLLALGDASKHFATSLILNADDVKVSKPDPEGYLIGIRRALNIIDARGFAPDGVFVEVIEDSQPGIRAGMAARAACVQYLSPGQEPMIVDACDAPRFRAKSTGIEVEQSVQELFLFAKEGKLPVLYPQREIPT